MGAPGKSDVLIVGGGVIGLSLARELHKKGVKNITVAERGRCGQEASWAAAGMLAPHAETNRIDPFYEFCSESNTLYPEFAESLLEDTGVNIELDRAGTLYLALTEADSADLKKRFDWQRSAGLKVEHLSAAETRKAEPFVSPDVRESLYFPEDWQVDNRKLMHALERYAQFNGITLLESRRVSRLLLDDSRVTAAVTAAGPLFADKIIFATGAWTSLIELGDNWFPVSVKPIKGQMISFHTAKRLFEHVIYSHRGYIVPRMDGRLLAGATIEDDGFGKIMTTEGAEYLQEMAAEIAPSLASLEISESWVGLRPYAPDGLPILGEIGGYKSIYTATAHYRNGILLAPLTARVMAELLLGESRSEYFDHFRPDRLTATAKSS